MERSIFLIGCGISGLTTGVVLQEAGWKVTIYTRERPADTVSAVAAAIWFPYAVLPRDKVARWSRQTYAELEKMATQPGTGVSMTPLTVLLRREEDAWWKDALPSHAIRLAGPDELPPSHQVGYKTVVPLVETPIHLPYLQRRFEAAGGIIAIREVKDLKELSSSNIPIINCAGLGARELVGDDQLYPIRGQILLADPMEGVEAMSADFTFDPAGEELAYIIPRRDAIVLGGTAQKEAYNMVSDELTSRDILDRCTSLAPQLRQAHIRSSRVGLRPGRHEIRLEREGNVIHNYGHGGGGYTVAWGCAFSVRDLLSREAL